MGVRTSLVTQTYQTIDPGVVTPSRDDFKARRRTMKKGVAGVVAVQHMGQNRGRAYICQEIFSNVGKKIQGPGRKFRSHPLGDLAICYKHSIVYQTDGFAGT